MVLLKYTDTVIVSTTIRGWGGREKIVPGTDYVCPGLRIQTNEWLSDLGCAVSEQLVGIYFASVANLLSLYRSS